MANLFNSILSIEHFQAGRPDSSLAMQHQFSLHRGIQYNLASDGLLQVALRQTSSWAGLYFFVLCVGLQAATRRVYTAAAGLCYRRWRRATMIRLRRQPQALPLLKAQTIAATADTAVQGPSVLQTYRRRAPRGS